MKYFIKRVNDDRFAEGYLEVRGRILFWEDFASAQAIEIELNANKHEEYTHYYKVVEE